MQKTKALVTETKTLKVSKYNYNRLVKRGSKYGQSMDDIIGEILHALEEAEK